MCALVYFERVSLRALVIMVMVIPIIMMQRKEKKKEHRVTPVAKMNILNQIGMTEIKCNDLYMLT